MIKKVEFPQYTNAAINSALTADKLNEVIEFLNSKYPDPKLDNVFEEKLKEGVKITARGGYYLKGKGFIKKEEAFV